MKIKIPKLQFKKRSGLIYGLLFVFLAIENFGYLVPATEILIGSMKYSDIGFLCAAAWIFIVFIKTKLQFKGCKLPMIPILYFVVWFLSSRVNRILYGQSYLDSFIRNRRILLGIILMYAIIIAVQKGYLIFEDVLAAMFFVGLLELLIDFAQFFLSDYIQFTYYIIDERYTTARVRAAYLLPLIIGYFSLDNFLNRKNKEVNLLVFIGSFFLLVGICKHRAPSLIVICTVLAAYLLWKKEMQVKFLLGIMGALVIVPLMLNLPIVQDAFKTAVSTDVNVNTLLVRDRAREYYLEEITKSPFAGFGESYKTNLQGRLNEGGKYGFIREDNGVWGFLYAHGIVGIAWVALLLISNGRKAYRLYKQKRRYVYLLYLLYETANLYMGMHWYYDYQYVLFLALALLECDYQAMETAVITQKEVVGTWAGSALICERNNG